MPCQQCQQQRVKFRFDLWETVISQQHGPYRRVLNKGLGPRQIRNIEGNIRAVAVELIEKFAADGKVDFCAEYANIFPIKVFLAFSDQLPNQTMTLP